jgi:lipoate-protein ligase A
MSLDYLLTKKSEIDNTPVLRFYGWKPYCLSLGKHQLPTKIDFETLKRMGFDIVRRPTGGSAIFHSEELTYSFILPGSGLQHLQIYKFFHEQLHKALRIMGVNCVLQENNQTYRLNEGQEAFACFNRSAFSELQIGGKKITGSAQKIFKYCLLQHGSILLGKKHLDIVDFLRVKKKKKEIFSEMLEENSTDFFSVTGKMPNIDLLIELILNQFKKIKDFTVIYDQFKEQDIENSKKFDQDFKLKA